MSLDVCPQCHKPIEDYWLAEAGVVTCGFCGLKVDYNEATRLMARQFAVPVHLVGEPIAANYATMPGAGENAKDSAPLSPDELAAAEERCRKATPRTDETETTRWTSCPWPEDVAASQKDVLPPQRGGEIKQQALRRSHPLPLPSAAPPALPGARQPVQTGGLAPVQTVPGTAPPSAEKVKHPCLRKRAGRRTQLREERPRATASTAGRRRSKVTGWA